MEDLNALSNDELKYRLTQFGFPNLPVTSTTRKVLIKKLRNHMDSEKSKLKRETSYATRYSSDEDLSSSSDVEKSTTGKKRIPRATIAAIPQSGRNSGPLTSNRTNLNMSPPTTVSPSRLGSGGSNKSNNLIYISPLIRSDADEESDSNQTDERNSSFSSHHSGNLSLGISSRASIGGSSTSVYNGSRIAPTELSGTQYSNFGNLRSHYSNDATDSGSLNSVPSTSGIGSNSTNGVHGFDELSSPYFTKRLMSFRNRNVSSTGVSSNPVLDSSKRFSTTPLGAPTLRGSGYLSESPNWSRYSNPSRDHSIVFQAKRDNSQKPDDRQQAYSLRNAFSLLFSRFNERYGVKQSLVPCILLTSLFIFFASVIIAYLTMNPDLSLALDAKAASYKLCPAGEIGFTNSQPTINCIEESELEPSFNLLKILIPELQKRIEFNRCTDSSAVFTMSAKEVIQFLLEIHPERSVYDTMRTLYNAEYLISKNPQWRVDHFSDASGQPSSSISISDVSRLRATQSNFYAIVKPRLPVACFLYNKLQTVFHIIGWIGVIALTIYSLVVLFKFIRSHLQTRRERLTNMVDDIINVLMEKAYDPDTACTDAASVVVNHLRDKLIPAAERSKMESVWNAAIRFIEQNESRVQFSVATRNGEDYRVMRWVDTVSPMQQSSSALNASSSSSGNSGGTNNSAGNMGSASLGAGSLLLGQRSSGFSTVKKWQDPAFDKTNKIKDPPTECLKIRHMFDKYESANPNLKQIIQDAILEKVAHTTCKIYDIQLDKQSCCVYVRCASSKDAGIIHDEVNGWWFDSRLVSIKFLRLDRYLQRFPNAVAGPACLKPSNTKNLSMPSSTDGSDKNQGAKRGADRMADDDDDDDDDENGYDYCNNYN